jgi:hypothetical protein
MKALALVLVCLSLVPAYSPAAPRGGGPGGPPPGPDLSGHMTKLFGDHSAFSATLEMQLQPKAEKAMTMPGKVLFLGGKSRFEMNLADVKGAGLPPDAAEQMKQMGMDKTIRILRPDKQVEYLIYPGLQAYVESAMNSADSKPGSDFTIETTELGKETVDGRACVKNKVVVTDKEGKKHECTVWNATDPKDFPVKVETIQEGNTVTMLFKDVKLTKPEAAQFEPPADFKKYDSMMSMMQQEMMKRMGGGMGQPPR